jgi:hypothetical protein
MAVGDKLDLRDVSIKSLLDKVSPMRTLADIT